MLQGLQKGVLDYATFMSPYHLYVTLFCGLHHLYVVDDHLYVTQNHLYDASTTFLS